MATVNNVFSVRNAGVRTTGLTPTWVFFKKISDNSDVTQPTITEVAQGTYKFSYDPANGEAVGQIDAGNTITSPADRYIDVVLPLDPSLLNTGVKVDMTQTFPTSNAPGTFGDALNACRAQGFGGWAIVGTRWDIYGADGTTIVHTFTLDSATAPTRRT